MATYRHWCVSLWRDPDHVSHCRILSSDKTEWRLISATLCGWGRCFVADQLWLMTRIREEEDHNTAVTLLATRQFTALQAYAVCQFLTHYRWLKCIACNSVNIIDHKKCIIFSAVAVFKPKTASFKVEPNRTKTAILLAAMWRFFWNFKNNPARSRNFPAVT